MSPTLAAEFADLVSTAVAVKSSIAVSESTVVLPVEVHQGIFCDGCQMHPISGARYKCTQCVDFDLCEKCKESGLAHPAGHAMIKTPTPEEQKVFDNWNTDRCHRLGCALPGYRRIPACSKPQRSGFDSGRAMLWTSRFCVDHHNRRRRYFKDQREYELWKENEVKDHKDLNDVFNAASAEHKARCIRCIASKSCAFVPLSNATYLCGEHIRECNEFLKEKEAENAVSLPQKRNRDKSEEESSSSCDEDSRVKSRKIAT